MKIGQQLPIVIDDW